MANDQQIFAVSVGPHEFRPLNTIDRFRAKGRCRHCFVPRAYHNAIGWQPARPKGDMSPAMTREELFPEEAQHG